MDQVTINILEQFTDEELKILVIPNKDPAIIPYLEQKRQLLKK